MTLTADLHISHSYTRTVRARGGDSGERVITAPASTRLRPNGSSGERHHVITVADGVGLACSDYGDPAARRTVVFLHGLCLSQQSWDHHVAYVLRRYGGTVRVISYDHRGHGRIATRTGVHLSPRAARRRPGPCLHRTRDRRIGKLHRPLVGSDGGARVPRAAA